MCSAQVDSKTRLSRRQRRHLRTNTCFGCKKESHILLSYPNFQAEPHCSGRIGPAVVYLSKEIERSFKGPIALRSRQGLQGARQKKEKTHVQGKMNDMLQL
jgi:hypothetical protein